MKPLGLILTLLTLSMSCRHAPADASAGEEHEAVKDHTRLMVQIADRLPAVVKVDGISRHEAELMAQEYIRTNVGCGRFTGIRDGGDFWIVDGRVGIAAQPMHVHLDKALVSAD